MNLKESIKNIVKRMNGEIPTAALVKRGLKVGKNFNRQQGSYIDPTHCFLVEIGDNVTFSIRVTILAHDASTKKSIGYTKIGKVVIGDNVFVGANVTILPNVVIGNNVVVGANSVVTKNIPDNCVAAGNPAKVICSIEEFIQRNTTKMENSQRFGKEYRFSKSMTEQKKKEIIEAVQQGIAYID
ncbi:hypothetical protein JCM31739_18970 [Faecalimonas canis]